MKGKSKKTQSDLQSDFKKALVKKALGYDVTETVEEYSGGEDGVKLVKKKVTKKNVPPDITALKMLLEDDNRPVSQMSDEQLKEEKERLIKLLLRD
ncbi:MAG: hypothetical protein IKB67_04385 [Clostridia bacterium]|nr:hypothetical protein [Clostridia bacterium]